MPRYIVERTFPDGLSLAPSEKGARAAAAVAKVNAREEVFWVHSYSTQDRKKSFCVYDGPDPERFGRWHKRTDSPWTGSRRSGFSTPTFFTDEDRANRAGGVSSAGSEPDGDGSESRCKVTRPVESCRSSDDTPRLSPVEIAVATPSYTDGERA